MNPAAEDEHVQLRLYKAKVTEMTKKLHALSHHIETVQHNTGKQIGDLKHLLKESEDERERQSLIIASNLALIRELQQLANSPSKRFHKPLRRTQSDMDDMCVCEEADEDEDEVEEPHESDDGATSTDSVLDWQFLSNRSNSSVSTARPFQSPTRSLLLNSSRSSPQKSVQSSPKKSPRRSGQVSVSVPFELFMSHVGEMFTMSQEMDKENIDRNHQRKPVEMASSTSREIFNAQEPEVIEVNPPESASVELETVSEYNLKMSGKMAPASPSLAATVVPTGPYALTNIMSCIEQLASSRTRELTLALLMLCVLICDGTNCPGHHQDHRR